MGKKKILVISAIVVVLIIAVLVIAPQFGFDLFATVSGVSADQPNAYSSVDELSSGKAYVWHHEGADIKDDLEGDVGESVFFSCITGDYNFKNKETEEELDYPRAIWIDSDTDDQIPTVTSSDKLIYVSSTEVPDGILFERFADYGYSIGVSNLTADQGGHYYITFADTDEDDYKYSIDMNSDASSLAELDAITKLYLDKVGSIQVDEDSVSDGGTVMGLKKDKTYTCEFYTGTFYQDFNLTANIHCFGSLERFTSYEYEFMHSNFIVIDIPDYFKTGYYFVNGVGLFRYVSDEDADTYNGEAYDEAIDWNETIIIYAEDGTVLYDPSDPDYEEDRLEENSDAGIDEESADKDTDLEDDLDAGTKDSQTQGKEEDDDTGNGD